MTRSKKNHILDLIFCINKVLFYFVNHASHVCFVLCKTASVSKVHISRKNNPGENCSCNRVNKTAEKSVWHDGVYVGKVEQWAEVQDIVKLKKKNITKNQVLL